MALRFGNITTIRRIGALLESGGADEMTLQTLERALKPISASIPFIPRKAKRGKLNKKWGVVMNEI
jgi:predicted transcriptional regulator of viral defense system